ncbi:hypothetical protein LOTGIDRAFT_156564 [Lottia gigantea]|uniref:Cadherin domain-containing protein n=1 Tax=Lottia gigantea TaxID=225164 RepID=V4BDW8_LOTGI|nr:hypothetical protein LOTGIDRAFT_156564 [Lottia gigantea]ESP03962.1 hypothetical protein LOTGIDRAFT_156564 [Lottia gigantea]
MASCNLYSLLLFYSFLQLVYSQCEGNPPRNIKRVLETDEPGYYLFNLTSNNDEWSFDIITPSTSDDFFRSYFNFYQHNDTYIFSVNKTLDLEDIYEQTRILLTSFTFKFYCTINNRQTQNYDYFLRVLEVNEFPPNFINPPFIRNITEDAMISTELIKLSLHAEDKDVNQTMDEIQGFRIYDYISPQLDGQGKFHMPKSQDGLIQLKATLDYDTMVEKFYILNVSVQDRGGLTDFTLITVNVLDVDDQPPEFYYKGCQTSPCSIFYQSSVADDFTGPLNDLSPAPIFARDRDSLNYSIRYSLVNGNLPEVKDHFQIDDVTGVVSVIKDFQDVDASSFSLTIQAEEESVNRRSTSTFLWVSILGRSTESQPTQVVTQLITATDDSALKYAMIALAIVIFLIIIAFILSIIFVRKKYRKPISPIDLSPAGSEMGTDDEDLSLSGSDNWPSPIPPGKQERIIASLPEGRGSLPPIQYVETGTPPTSHYQNNITHATLQRSGKDKLRKDSRSNDSNIFDGTREYDGPAELEFYLKDKTLRPLSASKRETELDPRYWLTVDNHY